MFRVADPCTYNIEVGVFCLPTQRGTRYWLSTLRFTVNDLTLRNCTCVCVLVYVLTVPWQNQKNKNENDAWRLWGRFYSNLFTWSCLAVALSLGSVGWPRRHHLHDVCAEERRPHSGQRSQIHDNEEVCCRSRLCMLCVSLFSSSVQTLPSVVIVYLIRPNTK